MEDEKSHMVRLPEVLKLSLHDIDQIRQTNARLASLFRGLNSAMDGVRRFMENDAERIRKAIAEATKDWLPAFENFAQHMEAKKVLSIHGILPHKSTPWARFDSIRPEDFPDAVLAYYSTEWHQAEKDFLSEIDSYDISEGSKDAFRDAVKCHSLGLYRPAVLTLLATAEMEFRRAFGVNPGQNAASLEDLRRMVLKAPAGIVIGHVAPIDLFKILDEHMYKKVKTADAVRKLSNDAIPNRHAAIHGLIQYNSKLNSLNSLIMADYVFFLISQLSEYLLDEDDSLELALSSEPESDRKQT